VHQPQEKLISNHGTKIEQENMSIEGFIAEGTKKNGKMQAKTKVTTPKAIADVLDFATTAEAYRAKALQE
jgi:hypothetical protein